ncbi:hypothetical protein S245_062027 [Arachis hypogaea]
MADPSHGGNPATDFTTNRDENPAPFDESDFSAAALKYIDEMLMEEDIDEEYNMFQHSSALLTAEKSLYDAIGQRYPSSASTLSSSTSSSIQHHNYYPNVESPGDSYSSISSGSTCGTTNTSSSADYFWSGFDLSMIPLMPNTLPFPDTFNFQSNPSSTTTQSNHRSDFTATNNSSGLGQVVIKTEEVDYDFEEEEEEEEEVQFLAESMGSSSKQSALYMDDTELSEFFDKVLLGAGLGRGSSQADEGVPKDSRGKKSRARKRNDKNDDEVIDLRSLLMQCAQAVSSDNRPMAKELLMQIKLHSSPTGDATQRLSHYFVNALEARMSGTGTHIHSALSTKRPSASDMVKAYQMYASACPFDKFGIRFSINSIDNSAMEGVQTLHIVEFGIRYGFKWPGLIYRLSRLPSGPPKLRITGIEYPLPGLKLEQTGQCLARYCERFNVPFEFNAVVAKKWERIKVEDLKIRENEFVAVNCMFRFENLHDETVVLENPRDSVLELIRKANPNVFVHGIINGNYDAAFFVTRFKEAMFHYSAMFDMLDNTVARDDPIRLMYEEAIFGKEVMNVVACEGNERIERPHNYKKWQVRNTRAGFRQLSLDEQMIEKFKDMLRNEGYHKDFMLHADGKWLLQGWKGRILYASSCWVPA